MAQIEVVFYQDEDGSVPALDAIVKFHETDPKVAIKMQALIEALEEQGHLLRRPMVGNLREGILELRGKVKGVNHRILFFYGGKRIAVLSHHITKTDKVPPKEIDLAVRRKAKFLKSPEKHTFTEK
jgi:phage-related protein